MLAEAELFVRAEQMLVEVLGRIRDGDRDIALPPLRTGAAPLTMAQAVEQHVRDDAAVPWLLLGGPAEDVDGPSRDVGQLAEDACAAAREVEDGEAVVDGQGLTTREVLLRGTVVRCLLAHYVAAYLGSTACPLPEELARLLWETTAPQAARWRELGYFRDPMPLPPHVSWRDRFLLTAGHEPHPLGHP
jgi:hypothetical protein